MNSEDPERSDMSVSGIGGASAAPQLLQSSQPKVDRPNDGDGDAGDAPRARMAVMTGLGVLSYFVLVYLIFFLTYTPVTSPHVLGVQGRYFVIALPMAAIFMASLINLELPRGVPALIAITGSIIAGVTSVDAVLKAHW